MMCHEAGPLLDPFVDRELDPTEAAGVTEHLEVCAACRQHLADLQALGRLLRSVPYHVASNRLRTTIAAAPRRSRIRRAIPVWAAAMTVAVVVGVVGFRARETARATAIIAEEVVNRHVSALMRDRLFEVRSANQHTVKPWFQGRVDFSPPVPDLAPAGFPLLGGRVDSIGGRAVAALVYQRREHIIEVFVWPAASGSATADGRSIRGFQERRWPHTDLSLWAVSDLNARELNEFVLTFESATQ